MTEIHQNRMRLFTRRMWSRVMSTLWIWINKFTVQLGVENHKYHFTLSACGKLGPDLLHFPAGAGCQVWLHFVPLTTMMMTLDKAEVFKWSLPGIFSCVSLLPPTDSPPMYYCTTQQPLMLLLKRLTFSDEWIPPPDPVPSVNLPTPGNAARIAKLAIWPATATAMQCMQAQKLWVNGHVGRQSHYWLF